MPARPMFYVLGPDARTPEPVASSVWVKGRGDAKLRRLGGAEPGDGWARVAQDYVDPFHISTVFLGFDHAFIGRPAVFETLVFREHWAVKDHRCDSLQARYATWDEALEGHRRIVERLRAEGKDGEGV